MLLAIIVTLLACFLTEILLHYLVPTLIGTSLNYFLDGKINRAGILFPGVGCFLIAVCLGSAVHSSNTADNKVKLSNLSSDYNARLVDSFIEGVYAWLDKDVGYGQGDDGFRMNEVLVSLLPKMFMEIAGSLGISIEKKLVAGDSIVFLRAKDGDLCVGIRRAKKVAVGGGEVSVSSVVEAVSCGVNGRPFEVVYYPRGSSPEFCVKASVVRDAMKLLDPIHWPNSPWHLLQIGYSKVDILCSESGKQRIIYMFLMSPYSARTYAGGDGSRQPTKLELEQAFHQSKYIATITKKLKKE
ncbi:hypothetical protein Ahy_B08g091783 isoform B [Arachis hypogaea]|uniref:Uncharacterized protein n=1 Tax=Arachis hypogaea TaxID=3818 RepID=A0A444Y2U2_ARAHY|nr:hypothetical protein Ahy_B08g091783 isoform B [Arachis hypogaea]